MSAPADDVFELGRITITTHLAHDGSDVLHHVETSGDADSALTALGMIELAKASILDDGAGER